MTGRLGFSCEVTDVVGMRLIAVILRYYREFSS